MERYFHAEILEQKRQKEKIADEEPIMNTVKYFFNFVLYDCMILIIKLSKAQVFKILECLLSGQKIDNERIRQVKFTQNNFFTKIRLLFTKEKED